MPRVLPFARRMLQTDVSTWSRERFSAVLLALLLASTWMVASAARAHADLRERYYSGLAVWRAKAPVPYDAPVAALRGLVAVPRANSLRVVVRADSVPERERNGMCRLAEEIGTGGSGGAEPVWIRLGPDIDPCVSRAAGGRLVHPAAPTADGLRAQIKDARWLMVDHDFRVRYSHREVPAPSTLRELAALLAPVSR